MKKIALIGASGMLGRDLLQRLERGFTCVAADIEDVDIADRDSALRWIQEVRPEILINVAAYTDVDGCERRRDQAMQVNGEGAGYLAEGCALTGARMMHISTDFVFDGEKETPYIEEDVPNPLSVYGSSKLLGEKRIAERLKQFLIVRTSWLYGVGGKNFVEAILGQAEVKNLLKVVQDQVGSPTYVPDLSRGILALLPTQAEGIVHLSNSGSCSWFEFAEKILEFSGKTGVRVEPLSSSELNRPAQRPAKSVLSHERYTQITGERMRHWEEGLRDYLKARTLS